MLGRAINYVVGIVFALTLVLVYVLYSQYAGVKLQLEHSKAARDLSQALGLGQNFDADHVGFRMIESHAAYRVLQHREHDSLSLIDFHGADRTVDWWPKIDQEPIRFVQWPPKDYGIQIGYGFLCGTEDNQVRFMHLNSDRITEFLRLIPPLEEDIESSS